MEAEFNAIPDTHPCPAQALTPDGSEIWLDAYESGEWVPLTLLIPLGDEVSSEVSQGQDQLPTHVGEQRYAWDFQADEGTVVHSAAGGIVVWVFDESIRFGSDNDFREDANWIVIDHGGGLFSSYVHLEAGSAQVEAGEQVSAGQPIAKVGLSGQTSGPHLHFQVENVWSTSLPAAFISPAPTYDCEYVPKLAEAVKGGLELSYALVTLSETSQTPADAFDNEGIAHIEGVPARLWQKGQTLAVSGRLGIAAESVYLLVFEGEDTSSSLFLEMLVQDNHFEGTLNTASLNAERYRWGLVATDGLATPSVERTIRVSIVH
jgi:murein DD-endopeptidase MepM/ murein hydrolase activator NlpD